MRDNSAQNGGFCTSVATEGQKIGVRVGSQDAERQRDKSCDTGGRRRRSTRPMLDRFAQPVGQQIGAGNAPHGIAIERLAKDPSDRLDLG